MKIPRAKDPEPRGSAKLPNARLFAKIPGIFTKSNELATQDFWFRDIRDPGVGEMTPGADGSC